MSSNTFAEDMVLKRNSLEAGNEAGAESRMVTGMVAGMGTRSISEAGRVSRSIFEESMETLGNTCGAERLSNIF